MTANQVRFTENETGAEVVIEAFHTWEPYEKLASITYPSGRRYAMPERELGRYFTIVSPQDISITAFGGLDDRPTQRQADLTAELEQGF